jgi:hypothetical protein
LAREGLKIWGNLVQEKLCLHNEVNLNQNETRINPKHESQIPRKQNFSPFPQASSSLRNRKRRGCGPFIAGCALSECHFFFRPLTVPPFCFGRLAENLSAQIFRGQFVWKGCCGLGQSGKIN